MHSRKGLSLSRSSPSLAAAYSLREYSQMKKRVPLEKSSSQPIITVEEIDRIGGNGRWRQRKAEEHFKMKQVEELERLRSQRTLEEERKKRRQDLENKRRRQQQEEEQKRQAKVQREKDELEMREMEQQRLNKRERMFKEQQEKEVAARQPVPCEACNSTGVCTSCEGKGTQWAVFLSSQVEKTGAMGFGKAPQGCEDCGGCRQNIVGELVTGSGLCPDCNGKGQVWPQCAFEPLKSTRSKFRFSSCGIGMNFGGTRDSSFGGSMDCFSPKSSSPSSPKVAFGRASYE